VSGQPEQLSTVHFNNGTRTSAGPGPGFKRLPPAEAAWLVKNRLATYGDRPPRGYGDRLDDGLRH
jgi:hypothetical protein